MSSIMPIYAVHPLYILSGILSFFINLVFTMSVIEFVLLFFVKARNSVKMDKLLVASSILFYFLLAFLFSRIMRGSFSASVDTNYLILKIASLLVLLPSIVKFLLRAKLSRYYVIGIKIKTVIFIILFSLLLYSSTKARPQPSVRKNIQSLIQDSSRSHLG